MYQEITDILNQETRVFQSILENEKSKRRHILTADGARLQELTRKTELLLEQAAGLEEERNRLVIRERGITKEDLLPTLKSILEEAEKDRPAVYEELKKSSELFRKTVLDLKMETEETTRLLETTARSMKRLLEGIKEISQADHEATYHPDKKKGDEKKRSARSILLNANA